MKMFKLFLILFTVSFFLTPSNSKAQSYYADDEIAFQFAEIQILIEKLALDLETLPSNIKRVAFFDLTYDKKAIKRETYDLLKGRIDQLLVRSSAMKLVGIPEALSRPHLIVVGTDSSLVVSNTFRTNNDEVKWFNELAEKYSLDAFLEGSVRYDEKFGFILNLRVLKSANRDVVWSTSLLSREILKKTQLTIGREYIVSAGVNMFSAKSYMTNTNNDSTLANGVTFMNYALRLIYKQPTDDSFRGNFGIIGGIHQISSVDSQSDTNYVAIKKTYFEVGVSGSYSFFKKRSEINDYWLDVFLQSSMYFPIPEDNLYSVSTGINLNVSYNIGIAFTMNYLLNNPQIIEKNLFINTKLDPIGYGISATFRF
jgi:hypothetical protein